MGWKNKADYEHKHAPRTLICTEMTPIHWHNYNLHYSNQFLPPQYSLINSVVSGLGGWWGFWVCTLHTFINRNYVTEFPQAWITGNPLAHQLYRSWQSHQINFLNQSTVARSSPAVKKQHIYSCSVRELLCYRELVLEGNKNVLQLHVWMGEACCFVLAIRGRITRVQINQLFSAALRKKKSFVFKTRLRFKWIKCAFYNRTESNSDSKRANLVKPMVAWRTSASKIKTKRTSIRQQWRNKSW